MRSFVGFRLSSHVYMVSALLCIVPLFRADWRMFAVLGVLVLIAAFLAVRVQQTGRRVLMGLLPALALPLATGLPGLLAGMLLVGYVEATLASGRFALELWRYRRETVTFLILCVFAALLSTSFKILYNVQTYVFAAVCLLESVLALRALRIGFGNKLGWELGNPAAFLVPAGIGGAFGVAIWAAVPLLDKLVKGIAWLIGAVMLLISRLMMAIPMYHDEEVQAMTDYTLNTEWYTRATETGEEVVPDENAWIYGIHLPWKWIAAAAAAALILALVVWLIRRSAKPELQSELEEDYLFQSVRDNSVKLRRRRKVRRGEIQSNSLRVRAIYREYLEYLRQNGITLRQSNTTAEISGSAEPVLMRSDKTLRALYRAARYSETDLDDAAVAAAEAALERLTGKQNETNSADAIALKS